MTLLAAIALAAPVECSPLGAARLIDEARIDPQRVPVTHPWLVPGLALSSDATDPELRAALETLCDGAGELSIDTGERWETAGWSAWTLLLTAVETEGCALHQRTIALTAGVVPGATPTWSLRGRLPEARTPIGDCATEPRYREEQVIAGDGEPVRLVLVVDRVGARRVRSELVVRRATEAGWVEQVLASPAPDRHLDGGSGPRFTLAHPGGETWVVASHDRRVDEGGCVEIPGQTVWTWSGDRWTRSEGREALTRLTDAGLWRLAGEDGWLLVLAQDDEGDGELLASRMRRLERRQPDIPLRILSSADFPELNPGFLIVTPPPFTRRDEAEAMERAWGRRAITYVKRAWRAAPACEAPTPRPRG